MNRTIDKIVRLARSLPVVRMIADSGAGLKATDPRLILITLAIGAATLPGVKATAGASIEERRAKIRNMASDTLQSLYRIQPGSQAAVEESAGYAVFDNTGVHVVLPSTARRTGIAIDSRSRKETFMKMRAEGGRTGQDVADCRMVFVFETPNAFDQFLNAGWDGSDWSDSRVGSGVKDGTYAGAFRVDRDIWVYQIVERGLAWQLTLAGTSYRRDDKLNKP